jgi:hypothetical protein
MKDRSVVGGVVLALAGCTAGGALAGAIAHVAGAAALLPAAIGIVAGGIAMPWLLGQRFAARLPTELDGWFARRRVLAVLWAIAAVLAVANTARVTVFMADSSQIWASAFPPIPESAHHQCLAAYIRAGELAARGHADLWNGHDYDGFNSGVTPDTGINGLAPWMTDPYEYPPAFATLPRAIVAATGDYDIIRTTWYGVSALAFWIVFAALALWAGGRAGATALLLAPAIALSMPLIFCLQWGQAHVGVLAAAVAGMLLLARGRRMAGALLLGFAIAAKIFPGLLLVHLAVRRRWADLAATCAAIVLLFALSAAVLGPATLHTYVAKQVPAMASGAAFAYTATNSDNYAPYGLAYKLSTFGIDAGRHLASTLAWIWGGFALIWTALASRGTRDRAHDAVLWLGILCLATLRSPFAPAYTGIGTLWLLAMARGIAPKRIGISALVVAAFILLQGFPPIGSAALTAALSLPSQLVTIAVAVLAVWPHRRD